MEITEVNVDQIDLENDKYSISRSLYTKNLVESLKKVGQISPVTLIKEDGKYIVVNGRRRIRALKDSGNKLVYANVLSENEINNLEILLLNYFDNKTRYTDLDKAALISRVKELCHFEDKDLLPILEILEIKPSLNNLHKYLKVDTLNPEFKELFYKEYFTFEQLVMFSEIQDIEYRIMLLNKILKHYKYNNNETREIIREVYEIAKRDKLSYEECFNKIIGSSGNNPNKDQIKKTIRLMRYPELVKVEKEFKEKLKQIEDIGLLEINHHPFFETNRIEIKFKLTDIDDFKEAMKRLSDEKNQEIFASLLELVKKGNVS